MSTNYYIAVGDEEILHIGKKSVGWTFLFNGQVHKSYDAWIKALLGLSADQKIVNEYGREYSVEEFVELVQDTLNPAKLTTKIPRSINDNEGLIATARNWVDRGFSFSNYAFS